MRSDRLKAAKSAMDEARRKFERASTELYEAEAFFKHTEFFEGKGER